MSDDRPTEHYQLSEAEALDAMGEFLRLHAEHPADTPLHLIGLVLRDPDGVPYDSAVWTDWITCIRKVKGLDASEEAVLRDIAAGGGWLGRVAAARLAKRRNKPATSRDIREP